jgi:peptidyl-prolyl cis-trans isomerase C
VEGLNFKTIIKGENMSLAQASHILVSDPKFCEELKGKIESGELTFEEAAQSYSSCPSGNSGGDLGRFSRGQMVPEFDKVVFNESVGDIHGPIATQFGYHLIKITDRQ